MGQDERLQEIRKSLDSAYQKIVKWKKTICKFQKDKLEKH